MFSRVRSLTGFGGDKANELLELDEALRLKLDGDAHASTDQMDENYLAIDRYNGVINLDPEDHTGTKAALELLLRKMAKDLKQRGLNEMGCSSQDPPYAGAGGAHAEYATAAATLLEAMTLLEGLDEQSQVRLLLSQFFCA